MATARFFGPVSDAAGGTERSLPAECGTVQAALDWLCGEAPALAGQLGRVRVAVNGEFVSAGHALAPGDELSLLSPASGG